MYNEDNIMYLKSHALSQGLMPPYFGGAALQNSLSEHLDRFRLGLHGEFIRSYMEMK